MPRFRDYLNKPEYLFRPSQVAQRLWRSARPHAGIEEVALPWGLRLRVRPDEVIGRAIWTTGIYDLAVSEALWRLADAGETAVDAGANIGFMTSLLAAKLGAKGAVYAFEPHPELFAELAANAALWTEAAAARVQLRQLGLSDAARDAALVEGDEFAHNRGTARVEVAGAGGRSVRLVTLDQSLPTGSRIGVLKADVEGHEASLLRGARLLLAARAARDVVYEDHQGERGEATAILRSHGYAVYRLLKAILGPVLAPAARSGVQAWAAPSYLATLEPERAESRLRARGWRCLAGRVQ